MKNPKNQRKQKSAVAAKRGNIFLVDPSQLVVVGVDTKDGPEHPQWDEDAGPRPLDEELIASIMMHGVFQNIIARKDGTRLLIIAGRDRTLNAREANKRLKKHGRPPILVPVVLHRGSDAEAADVTQIENSHRRVDNPMLQARRVARLANVNKLDVGDIARQLKMSTVTVKHLLTLLDLDGSVQKAVEAGTLAVSAAAKLAKLPRADQKKALAGAVAEAGTKKVTAARVAKAAGGPTARPGLKEVKAASSALDTYIMQLAEDKKIKDDLERRLMLDNEFGGTERAAYALGARAALLFTLGGDVDANAIAQLRGFLEVGEAILDEEENEIVMAETAQKAGKALAMAGVHAVDVDDDHEDLIGDDDENADTDARFVGDEV
jgi:ParB family chromosome partitioning protein